MNYLGSAFLVFDASVVSNTHDFEVCTVTHEGLAMRGVVAKNDLTRCPLFIGAYAGILRSAKEVEVKLTSYMARHGVDWETADQMFRYNVSSDRLGQGCEMDPTDDEGRVLPEFAGYMALYVNEAPPHAAPNATYVFNAPRKRYEMWLLKPVQQGEEIFTCYGRNYARAYDINTEACQNWNWLYIPGGSTLIPDRRGAPPPWTPDL